MATVACCPWSKVSNSQIGRSPPGAEITFDGTKTQLTGTTRRFESPPIATGKTFKYQIVVAAFFDHFAAFENQDAVEHAHRSQTVRDDNRGPSGDEALHRFLDQRLGLGVEA